MKLYIPGPVNVSERITNATNCDMISHRCPEFREMFSEIKNGLQKILFTKNKVLISTSSGSGLMEGAIRNCVNQDVLVCVSGAFGKKWADIAIACGKNVDILENEYGKPIDENKLREKLKEKKYEAVCITHNETSTGITNPVEELSKIVKENGALVLVDAVSSMGGAKIEVDKLGLDVCLASSQKCFALPPGLSVVCVSDAALKKAEIVKGKGYYFDFIELAKNYDKDETPYTPAVGLMIGMKEKIRDILEEGIEERFSRHKLLADTTRQWAKENGFELFADEKYLSNTVTCIRNTKNLNLSDLKKRMLEKGYFMDTGYRKLNEYLAKNGEPDTFRIAHMGDLKVEELKEMLTCFEETEAEKI
jgi:aspartate aminotransferase-like enzyme